MKKRAKRTVLLALMAGMCLPLLGGSCLSQILLEIAGESVAALIPTDFLGGGNTN